METQKHYTMKTKSIIILLSAALVFGGITGFFIGRAGQVIKETHTIEYREGKQIKIEVPTPYPVTERTTTIEEKWLPGKIEHHHDTLAFDTAAVIKDYLLERTYSVNMFNSPERGNLTVNTTVQYNRQMKLAIDYTPINQVETNTKTIKPTFTPYIGASVNSMNYLGISAGLFYHNIGAEYQYHANANREYYHEVGIKVKL